MVEVNPKQHFDTLLMELKKSLLTKFNKAFSHGDGYLGTKVDCVTRC